MAIERIIRQLRRSSAAGVVWAMMPLMIVGGAPTASCACVACLCGAACPLDRSTAANQASGDCSTNAAHSAQSGCGCCKVADAPGRSQANRPPRGTGFSDQQSRCHAVIAVRSAVQTSATAPGNEQMPALAALPVQVFGNSLQSFHRLETPDTGPPIDLTLTLCRLVI